MRDMPTVAALAALALSSALAAGSPATTTPASEREALACFAAAAGGARSWFRSDGWLGGGTTPVCKWHGVGCGLGGSVVSLTLGDNNLTGR